MSRLIAVSAPVGGGKTSMVQGLAGRMDGAAIHFDSYETLTTRPHGEILEWMKNGAEVDELTIEGLPDHLRRLKAGEAVTDPHGVRIESRDLIFYETPFARQHRATGELIDFSIWIDTPLDVALARNLREFLRQAGMRDSLSEWLPGYLDNYLEWVRELLLMQQQTVGKAADLVLDGTTALTTNLSAAEHALRARFVHL